MRRQQLELVTIQSVERVLEGHGNEDSLIEFKSEWPTESKARQLAGHANSARGEEIVWIVGVDEKARKLTSPESVDLAQWWAQICKRFDGQVTPEMMDLVVQIGDRGSVTALAFQTDRAPYVVNTQGGATEREVPIRDGTRTRSATRYELLKLLGPAKTVPVVTVLDASAVGSETIRQEVKRWGFSIRATLYVDQHIDDATFFPLHGMRAELEVVTSADVANFPLRVNSHNEAFKVGADWRADGLMVSGPTAFGVLLHAGDELGMPVSFFEASSYRVKVSFEVAGAQRAAKVNLRLPQPKVEENPNGLGHRLKSQLEVER
ncbi:ATP-binding protein [Streptomyces sp. NBC_00124]|uniref:hypothetical protein n=1 Tax=Streptomyces sp. NBC_00124 TaxID=2975662 RepID=UPI00225ABD67|nr:hypothetical protein [Streptomyces sp. NBC_00124]MCX5363200.1 ATP-binding protein [Streptomyces sp. NBC_00124]